MRKALGVGVLLAGVAGLGLWARAYQAPQIQDLVAKAATAATATSVHNVTTRVSGRDITVSGIADSEAERSALLGALDAVTGRRVVNDGLSVLAAAQPFTLSLSKEADQPGLRASGAVPTEAARAELAPLFEGGTAGLTLASGAPKGWIEMVKAAAAALAPLDFGHAELIDRSLKVVGQARTPTEEAAVHAALAGLPKDAVTVELSLLDDGTPPEWTLDFSAGQGGRLTGKLPPGLDGATIAAALGLPGLADNASHAILGPAGNTDLIAVLRRWLPQLETLRAVFRPEGTELVAGVGAGADIDLTGQAMAADLAAAPGSPPVRLRMEQAPAAQGADGTRRTNAATGQTEMLSDGFWLPVVEIQPSVDTCTRAADQILQESTINFVSGSDRLDTQARAVINRLASVLLPCTLDGRLRAQIGGHTDSTGDATMNLGLSQRRATAVRLELVARGVPGRALRAQGFGDTRPIAPNDTEAGKAANRRTTIEWSQ